MATDDPACQPMVEHVVRSRAMGDLVRTARAVEREACARIVEEIAERYAAKPAIRALLQAVAMKLRQVRVGEDRAT